MTNSNGAAASRADLPDRSYFDLLAFNEKMAELGRISAGIIHEVNTPLSVIISAAQLAMQEDGMPEAAQELVQRIHEEAVRLSQMTRGILSFAGRDDESSADVDIRQTIRDVLDLLKYEIRKRSITVEEEYDEHTPLLPEGGNRLKQVLLNLVVNALHAMDDGGVLTLSCSVDEEGKAVVRVADTGSGIPHDIIDKIFDPFYTTRKKGEGTGLGLFVSRNLVQELNGSLLVDSVPGAGTAFTLIFPPPQD